MKIIKLVKISYHNFKGIKDFTLDLNDKQTVVLGKNATGKTTLFDGFTWLLFGKNSNEVAQFSPKPLDQEGKDVLGAEPMVEAELSIGGKLVELRRELKEHWTKPRNQLEKKRGSDVTNLYVDEVPYKLKDYNEYINSIIDEDTFKMLTNPFAFNNLDWKKQRKILMDLVGDVTDDDVIGTMDNADSLHDLLSDHTSEEQRQIIAAKRRKIKQDINGIPARIDEASRAIPELDENASTRSQLEDMLTVYHESEQRIQAEVQTIKASGGADKTAIFEAKAKLQGDIAAAQSAFLEGNNMQLQSLYDDIAAVTEQSRKIDGNRRKAKQALLDTIGELDAQSAEREKLLKQYYSIKGQVFDDSQLVCPTCGQELPADKQDEIRGRFNTNRSEALTANKKAGTALKETIENNKHLLPSLKEDLESKTKELDQVGQRLTDLKNELDMRKVHNGSFEDTTKYKEFRSQMEELDAKLVDTNPNPEALSQQNQELGKIRDGIRQVQGELSKYDQIDTQNKRITELREEEDALKDRYNDLDRQASLLDEFVRTRVTMLEGRINQMFNLVSFKLFNEQKNGELVDTCEAMVGGVPFSTDLNNAARINAGLDIINTLSKTYDVAAPIFVDNAESVNDLIATGSQEIELVVSDDQKLTVQAQTEREVA